MQDYHGASYVSVYLGVSLTSIHNWRADTASGFPEPVVSITGITGMRAAFGWSPDQLPELRSWYNKRFQLDEVTADTRWKAIDSALESGTAHTPKERDMCDGQEAFFSVPAQRSTEQS